MLADIAQHNLITGVVGVILFYIFFSLEQTKDTPKKKE